jgi:hypothetical protein
MKTEKEIRKQMEKLLSDGANTNDGVEWKYWVCHGLNWVLEG